MLTDFIKRTEDQKARAEIRASFEKKKRKEVISEIVHLTMEQQQLVREKNELALEMRFLLRVIKNLNTALRDICGDVCSDLNPCPAKATIALWDKALKRFDT